MLCLVFLSELVVLLLMVLVVLFGLNYGFLNLGMVNELFFFVFLNGNFNDSWIYLL